MHLVTKCLYLDSVLSIGKNALSSTCHISVTYIVPSEHATNSSTLRAAFTSRLFSAIIIPAQHHTMNVPLAPKAFVYLQRELR